MKIITFNANGIRSAARKGFYQWFVHQNAEFLCLQETKAQFKQLEPNLIFFPKNYYFCFCDARKKGYSGVAIYAKKRPKKIIKKLGIDWADSEGRYIQFDYDKFSIASIYIPSGTSGEERQKYKMEFLKQYSFILLNQIKQRKDFIICGDINIIHKEIDIKNWKQNQKTSGVLPEERAWLDYIFYDLEWTDAFRVINNQPLQYTWWSNRGQARAKNIGWRIDYQIVSPVFKKTILAENIYKDIWFSDHAPLSITYDYQLMV